MSASASESGPEPRPEPESSGRGDHSQPGPNQQITDYPVVFDVVEGSESRGDTAPE